MGGSASRRSRSSQRRLTACSSSWASRNGGFRERTTSRRTGPAASTSRQPPKRSGPADAGASVFGPDDECLAAAAPDGLRDGQDAIAVEELEPRRGADLRRARKAVSPRDER